MKLLQKLKKCYKKWEVHRQWKAYQRDCWYTIESCNILIACAKQKLKILQSRKEFCEKRRSKFFEGTPFVTILEEIKDLTEYIEHMEFERETSRIVLSKKDVPIESRLEIYNRMKELTEND